MKHPRFCICHKCGFDSNTNYTPIKVLATGFGCTLYWSKAVSLHPNDKQIFCLNCSCLSPEYLHVASCVWLVIEKNKFIIN